MKKGEIFPLSVFSQHLYKWPFSMVYLTEERLLPNVWGVILQCHVGAPS